MIILVVILFTLLVSTGSLDYCIIGAGPGGIQLAYYLQKSGLEYIIIERNSVPGSFFELYPRSRTLISINKRHTGEINTEFQMRHDWNSLLSDDPTMIFKYYSKEMFPPADSLLRYLEDYVKRFNISIHYGQNVEKIIQYPLDKSFVIFTSGPTDVYNCNYVVASTGISQLNSMEKKVGGFNLVKGYDTVSHDPGDYEGKKVLILGKGNSAFETADLIYGQTDYVHLLSRDRVKLSWNTHYVGDVRGVNNQLLDTYQLKSLDALIERDLDSDSLSFEVEDDMIFLNVQDPDKPDYEPDSLGPYDVVINCLGFNYDPRPFLNITNTPSSSSSSSSPKYPEMGWDFQATQTPNLYYAGAITHGLDKRVSSGGFIHGFRYTARSLAWLLAARNHGVRWPSEKVPLYGVVSYMLKRMNEMNGPYQMFYVLVDVYVKYGDTVEVFKDVPHGTLHKMHDLLAEKAGAPRDMIVIRLEYGAGYSKIGGDPFRLDRVELDPFKAHTCNFIHPVVYHFTGPPREVPVRSKALKGAASKLHLSEDLYTDFATTTRHYTPLSNFIGTVWGHDMSYTSTSDCLARFLTRKNLSEMCRSPAINVFEGTTGEIRKTMTLLAGKPILNDLIHSF